VEGFGGRFVWVLSTASTHAHGRGCSDGQWWLALQHSFDSNFPCIGKQTRTRVYVTRFLLCYASTTINDYLLIYCYWIGSHVYNVFNDNYDSGRRVYPSHTQPGVTSVLESSLKQERPAWLREGIIIKGKNKWHLTPHDALLAALDAIIDLPAGGRGTENGYNTANVQMPRRRAKTGDPASQGSPRRWQCRSGDYILSRARAD
jgi:hypothetical protein